MNRFNSRPEGFTINQVSKMLGVKPSTVRSWISRKEMRAFKFENRRYITAQQINEFQQLRRTGEFVDTTYANGPIRS